MAALEKYAHRVWKLLAETAKPDQEYGEGEPVFRGKYTEVFDSLGISKSFYSPIRKYLIDNRYIEIVEQGSRGRDSIFVLWQEPPADVATDEPGEGKEKGAGYLTPSARFAMLEERVEALRGWRESQGGINIGEALRNFEQRISRLESLTTQVPSKSTNED